MEKNTNENNSSGLDIKKTDIPLPYNLKDIMKELHETINTFDYKTTFFKIMELEMLAEQKGLTIEQCKELHNLYIKVINIRNIKRLRDTKEDKMYCPLYRRVFNTKELIELEEFESKYQEKMDILMYCHIQCQFGHILTCHFPFTHDSEICQKIYGETRKDLKWLEENQEDLE